MVKRDNSNLTGQVFGKWTVVEFDCIRIKNSYYKVKCECGFEKSVAGNSLKRGDSKGCRVCLSKDKEGSNCHFFKHGLTYTPTWNSWKSMIRRCVDPNHENYKYYGGRGIKIDSNWDNFETFYLDMGEKPTPKHQLDRIDSDGNYTKNNCRWVSAEENSRNRRSNIKVIYNNKEKCLKEWAETLNLKYSSLYHYFVTKKESFDIAITLAKSLK